MSAANSADIANVPLMVQCTMPNAQCTMHNVAMHNAQCTMHNVAMVRTYVGSPKAEARQAELRLEIMRETMRARQAELDRRRELATWKAPHPKDKEL